MRVPLIGGVVLVAVLAMPEAAAAQGAFGIGGRLTWVHRDVSVDEDSTRFMGGHIRARLSPKTAFLVHGEPLAMDALAVRIQSLQGWTTKMPQHLETVPLVR